MALRAVLLASVLALVPAIANADSPQPDRPRGTYVIVEPPDRTLEGPSISNILYVNRCAGGCQISPNGNDSRTNQSTIVSSVVTLSEFQWSQQVWDDMMVCLREAYLPYNVQITETDPGTEQFHHEAIVAGTPQEAGLQGGIGGIAPLAGDCRAINNVISFSFANSSGPNWAELCWTVAQESAHAFGLDHEFDCTDPMTYLPGCGQKFFRDDSFSCGEFEARSCACGGTKQNSHRKLLNVFGKGQDPPPPEVSVGLPVEGADVVSQFSIYGFADDKRGIRRVELVLNGYKWGEQEGNGSGSTPYIFTAPGNLPDGVIDVEIRAFNDLEVPSSAIVTVTKGEPCTSADTCLDGMGCADGKCSWPAPTQDLGESCDRDQDCFTNLCPDNGGTRLCSEFCEPSVTDACGEGFECLPAGGSGVCWPVSEGGGCCSVGNRHGVPWPQVLIAFGVLAIVIRRRR